MRISDWSSDVCSSDLLGLNSGHLVRSVQMQLLATPRSPAATLTAVASAMPRRDGAGEGRLPAPLFRAMRSSMSASGTDLEFPVRLVDLEATFALRKAVLRPWLTPEEARATWADTPEHFQVGALQNGPHGSRVASTAGFLRSEEPT